MKSLLLFFLLPLALSAQTSGVTFHVQTLSPNQGRLPQVVANPYAERWTLPAWAAFRPGLDSLVNLDEDNPDEFIYTVKLAYAGHYPLVLSPDVIWYLIFRGFSGHVTYMAETDSLRPLIIRRPGTEKIRITLDTLGSLPPDSLIDWPGMLHQFRQEARREFQPAFDSLVAPRFSTTDAFQTSVQNAALLACVKDYFDLRSDWGVMCGIPAVTLEGTSADWRDIRARTEKLGVYGMEWWMDDLLPVLDQFVAASEGHADTTFWQGMYKPVPSFDQGCGDNPDGSGWVGVFFPYATVDGEPEPNLRLKNNDFSLPVDEREFEIGFSSLPMGITIKTPGYTEFREYEVMSGFGGRSQDPATHGLRPELKLVATLYQQESEIVPMDWVTQSGSRQVLVARAVGWKRLSGVPRSLPGLNILDASNNQIRRMPPDLIRMQHLDTLQLGGNRLEGAGYVRGKEDRYGWEKQHKQRKNSPVLREPSPFDMYTTNEPEARSLRFPVRTSLRYVDLRDNYLDEDFLASLALWRPRHQDTLTIDFRDNRLDTLPEALSRVRYPLALLLNARDPLPGPAMPPNVRIVYISDPVEATLPFDAMNTAPSSSPGILINQLRTCSENVFLPLPKTDTIPAEDFFQNAIPSEEPTEDKSGEILEE